MMTTSVHLEPTWSDAPEWMSKNELLALGFDVSQQKIDYGVRWGASGDVGLPFSPNGSGQRGFLFADQSGTARYCVLATDTDPQAIEAARAYPEDHINAPDGYLYLAAAINGQPEFTPQEARRLWLDCVQGDLTARQAHEQLDLRASNRFEAAFACVIASSARVSAEQTYIDTLLGVGEHPVVLTYRLVGRDGWSGRLPATDTRSAVRDAQHLRDLATVRGFTIKPIGYGRDDLARDGTPQLAKRAAIEHVDPPGVAF